MKMEVKISLDGHKLSFRKCNPTADLLTIVPTTGEEDCFVFKEAINGEVPVLKIYLKNGHPKTLELKRSDELELCVDGNYPLKSFDEKVGTALWQCLQWIFSRTDEEAVWIYTEDREIGKQLTGMGFVKDSATNWYEIKRDSMRAPL